MKKLIVLIILFYSNLSFPWGSTGHRITGLIAENHLNKNSKQKVKTILSGTSLAEISTWADEVRSDPNKKYYDKFAPWHYVEIPDGQTYESSKKNPAGNIIEAIKNMRSILQSKTSTPTQKKEALALIVHFIGDLHQPLHVGNGKDLGGNWCFVKWFGKTINLHKLWDEALIDYSNLSYTEYVYFIDRASKEEIKEISKGTVIDWAHESMLLRDSIYPQAKITDKNNPRNYCKSTPAQRIKDPLMPELGYEYHYKHKKLLDSQLLKAGIRLANILNETL